LLFSPTKHKQQIVTEQTFAMSAPKIRQYISKNLTAKHEQPTKITKLNTGWNSSSIDSTT
jgi:hypothetical protein